MRSFYPRIMFRGSSYTPRNVGPTIPDKTSVTLAKFLNKTQVSKHPPPFPHRTMLFMPLKQRSTNLPTLNIDLGGQGGIFLGL